MATRAIRLPAGDGGETSYTLQGNEYFQLVSVVGSLTAAIASTGLVPTVLVTDSGGQVIAEIANAVAFV